MPTLLRGSVVAAVALGLGLSAAALASAADDPVVVRASQKSAQVPKKKSRAKSAREKVAEAPAKNEAKPADGAISFARDVAPIFVSNCSGCHNTAQKRGKLDLSTFEKMMEGTPTEKVVTPGNPAESHLVLRIKGEETPRMPQVANKTLSEASIAKIEAWVKAGALLDAGLDPKAPIQKYAASPEDLRKNDLARMSSDERDKQVEAAGRERWKKADPKANPEVTPGTHFLLFGTLPKARAGAALKAVEGQYAQVKALLGPAAVDWGEKGSLYVFNDAGSYNEFVRVVENREVEDGDVGSAKFNIPRPYVAVVDPLGGRDEPAGSSPAPRKGRRRGASAGEAESGAGGAERALGGLLAEHFAIGAANREGKAPRWVTLGLGALVASKADPRSAYPAKVRRTAYELFDQGWKPKANEALGDATKTENVRAVGFAVLEWLSSVDRSVIPEFVKGMQAGGEKLDDVITGVLNGSREQMLEGSGEFVASHYGR